MSLRERAWGGRGEVELACDATRFEHVGWFRWQNDGQYAKWLYELEDCAVELEPGAWEAKVVRRFRHRGREGDAIHHSKLLIIATRW